MIVHHGPINDETDFVDTFIKPALVLMHSSERLLGTIWNIHNIDEHLYQIIYVSNRSHDRYIADASSYSADQIGTKDFQDHNSTVNNYLHVRDGVDVDAI